MSIRLGISSCLLGNNVRYNGGHKLDTFLRDHVGAFVDFEPVCPEAETGLGIPREAMRLVGDPAAPRLKTIKTGVDLTERMQAWARKRLDGLAAMDLCGYVFKSRSPSSGMARVKVYPEGGGAPSTAGSGIFAAMFMKRFPQVPVEDEGRLNDPGLRENFFERVFARARWLESLKRGRTRGELVAFHTAHKLMLLSHSQEHYRALGRLVAQAKGRDADELYAEYEQVFTEAMKRKATVKKHLNVLQHAMGYFKKDLSADEKKELLEVFDAYAQGHAPLIVPVTLINHYVRKYGQEYLAGQRYLNPHPVELRLRTYL